jgi:DUF177 domain-containing protein
VFFHVRDLELKPARFDVVLPPGSIEFLDPKLKQSEPLQASGKAELVMGSLGEIRVTGQVKVRLQADCDRCLEPANFPVDSSFELYYRPVAEDVNASNAARRGRRPEAAIPARAVRVEEKAIDAGEAEMGFYEGDGLELNDVLREFVLLALPMQRLCEENCKGICPVCGQNRNQNECRCQTTASDDRWAALKEIRKNAES